MRLDGALAGLWVIEYAENIAGSYCAKLMADLGAEVVKIEDPATGGDPSRRYGPFPDDIPHPEKSGLFLWLNTNKLGITLNLKSSLGRKVLKKLLPKADVLVHNLTMNRVKELGLDYDTLKTDNPRLIVTAITPFGQDGPYKDFSAHGINCSAAGGTSVATGEPEREPLVMPLSAGAYQAGASGAGATLAAVLHRDKSGQGQSVDISEVEVLANNHVGTHLLTYIYRGVSGIRRGHHGGYFYYPCACLPCKDGYVVLLAPQLTHWLKFVELMGNPEWAKNPRYRNRRVMAEQYPDEADTLLLPWLKERTKEEIFSLARKHHLPFAPVQTMDEVVDKDPQLRARGFFFELRHPEAGTLRYPGPAYELSLTPVKIRHPAPLLGEHNEYILGKRLGYSPKELERLREYGVI